MTKRSALPDPTMDREANAFAMALLMPGPWVRADVEKIHRDHKGLDEGHVQDLANRYGVSVVMMTLRLCDLGLRRFDV